MSGYIGSKASVTQVDGYNRTEADDRYVNASGDTMTGDLIVNANVGIGTSLPIGKLDVSDGTNPLSIDSSTYNEIQSYNRPLLLNRQGNSVGINTSSPASDYKLDVNGAITVGGTYNTGTSTNGGGVNIGFDAVNGGKIEALDPAVAWYPLTIGASETKFATFGAERIRIDASGNVGIGNPYTGNSSRVTILRDNPTTYNSAQLELVSNAGDVILGLHAGGTSAVCMDHVRGGAGFRFVNLVRTAHVPIEASAFNVNSDYRVKENITDLTGASERLKQLPVHRFSFIEGSMMYRDGAIVDGFLAHEVQAVVPEAVTGEKDAMRMESYEITPEERDAEGNIVTEAVYGEREVPDLQSIDQSKLVPLLTAALQEALGRIETLEADVAALKGATNV